jgi:hypothetical protein
MLRPSFVVALLLINSSLCQASDYDCDGTVNALDLGLWAGGLGVPCDANR